MCVTESVTVSDGGDDDDDGDAYARRIPLNDSDLCSYLGIAHTPLRLTGFSQAPVTERVTDLAAA